MYGKTINMGKLTLQKHVHPAVTATKKSGKLHNKF